MKEFMIDGHKIVAVPHNEEKDNVPVIFIHGLTANVRFWGHVQPSILTDSLKWYAMTLPGHFPAVLPDGFSPMDLTTKMMAETLWGAINELVGDQPVILVGHSTGGFAALALSIYHPEIVKSICSMHGKYRVASETLQAGRSW